MDISRAYEYYDAGVELEQNGETEAALEAYEKAVKTLPSFAEAFFALGNLQHMLGNIREALACLKRSLKLKPCTEARCAIGLVYEDTGKFDRALTYYKKAVTEDPGCLEAYNRMGAIFMEKGNFKFARHYFNLVIECFPEDAYARKMLECLPRYEEFERPVFSGVKEDLYINNGTMVLGTEEDNGIELYYYNHFDFFDMHSVSVVLKRFLSCAQHFGWPFTSVCSLRKCMDPAAKVIAESLGIAEKTVEDIGWNEYVLLLLDNFRFGSEDDERIRIIRDTCPDIFLFSLGFIDGFQLDNDARAVPQVISVHARVKLPWDLKPADETGWKNKTESLKRSMLKKISAMEDERNLVEQLAWYEMYHPNVNFQLRKN